jgi:tetratricopeptide (TPR) repeat protein/glycosyltransferase involved in cell wall biosynthesis
VSNSAATPPQSSQPAGDRPGLLIAHVGPAAPLDEGAAVYRTRQPCRALGELADVAVVSGSILSPALSDSRVLLNADVLVIHDVADPDLLPVVAARRRHRKLSVYEVTRHLFAGPPAAPAPPRAPDLVERSLRPMLARQADCLQVSTTALDAHCAGLNPRRAVFPSQLWDAPPPTPARRPDRVVIGWGGSRAHRDDLRAVIPALAGVMERHPEVELAVMTDATVRPLLDLLPAGRTSYTPWGSLAAYYRFLEGIDIGLAPLAPTAYNRCLGDTRFVEYAAHGVLAICADLEPYRDAVRPGETGYLFADAAELETVLERALAEGEVRAAIPARAARYVAAERSERRHAKDRLGFYLSVAAQMGFDIKGRRRQEFPPAELRDERAGATTFPESRYYMLGTAEVERLLEEGLRQKQVGEIAEARRCFLAAARLAPRSHLPPLLLGSIEPPAAAIEALSRAEALNPMSCQAAYLRGVRLLEVGDVADAAAAFERARTIAPGYGAPQERLGMLAEAAGRVDDACRLFEEAALQNPTFALPIARLAEIAQKAGKIDKAVGLLERILADDPDLSLTNFLVGRVYVELHRYHQARVHLLRAIDGAEDRAAVLTALAMAERGLGNHDAAQIALEEARH